MTCTGIDYGNVFLNALNNTPINATPYGSSVADPTNYNALLWKSINTDRNMTSQNGGQDGGYSSGQCVSNNGAFFVIATFSGTKSPPGTNITGNYIDKYFTNGLTFDKYGNLNISSLELPVTSTTTYTWRNPLAPGPFNSLDTDASNKIFKARNNIVTNYSGKTILMKDSALSSPDSNIYYVLYNPIHSKDYKTYYSKTKNADGSQKTDIDKVSDPLPQKYCEMIADKSKNPLNAGITNPIDTSSTTYQSYSWTGNGATPVDLPGDGDRNYGDVSCYLLYDRECVNFAAGGHASVSGSYPYYPENDLKCTCSGGLAATSSLNSRVKSNADQNDSFITSFNEDSHRVKIGSKTDPCQGNNTYVTCAINLTGADGIQLAGSTVQNNCAQQPVDCKFYPEDDKDHPWIYGPCIPASDTSTAGTQTVTKTVQTQENASGSKCNGTVSDKNNNLYTDTVSCTMTPQNCVYGEWSNAAACSTNCGPGTQLQNRKKLLSAKYGGTCESDFQITDCVNNPPCPTGSPAQTPSPTVAQTPSPTVTQTPSPTVTQTPSPTVTQTPSPTVTQAPTSPSTSAISTNLVIGAVVVVTVSVAIYFYMKKT
jgi:hypothetical protein